MKQLLLLAAMAYAVLNMDVSKAHPASPHDRYKFYLTGCIQHTMYMHKKILPAKIYNKKFRVLLFSGTIECQRIYTQAMIKQDTFLLTPQMIKMIELKKRLEKKRISKEKL